MLKVLLQEIVFPLCKVNTFLEISCHTNDFFSKIFKEQKRLVIGC